MSILKQILLCTRTKGVWFNSVFLLLTTLYQFYYARWGWPRHYRWSSVLLQSKCFLQKLWSQGLWMLSCLSLAMDHLITWQGSADRVLIYLTLYISECLKKLQRVSFISDLWSAYYYCKVCVFSCSVLAETRRRKRWQLWQSPALTCQETVAFLSTTSWPSQATERNQVQWQCILRGWLKVDGDCFHWQSTLSGLL